MSRALIFIKRNPVNPPLLIKSFNVVGPLSRNQYLHAFLSQSLAAIPTKTNIPVLSDCVLSPKNQTQKTSEAEKIAWMCWELMNADEHVDLCQLDPCYSATHEKIPLGSYVADMKN